MHVFLGIFKIFRAAVLTVNDYGNVDGYLHTSYRKPFHEQFYEIAKHTLKLLR